MGGTGVGGRGKGFVPEGDGMVVATPKLCKFGNLILSISPHSTVHESYTQKRMMDKPQCEVVTLRLKVRLPGE